MRNIQNLIVVITMSMLLCSCGAIKSVNVDLGQTQNQQTETKGIFFEPFIWKDETPESCPFPRSDLFVAVEFTGKASDYYCGDTFYPSWADDDNLYSPFTDGTTDGMNSSSGSAENATTGNAVMVGNDPLNLIIKNTPEQEYRQVPQEPFHSFRGSAFRSRSIRS